MNVSPISSYPVITLTVNVANNAAASVTNTANVSGGGEIITDNDTANDTTTITQLPDLTISKNHIGNFTQGQTGATYMSGEGCRVPLWPEPKTERALPPTPN